MDRNEINVTHTPQVSRSVNWKTHSLIWFVYVLVHTFGPETAQNGGGQELGLARAQNLIKSKISAT